MALLNCRKCGRAFTSMSGKPVCPQCIEAENEEYSKVREFVKENPKVSVNKVSEATGVSIERIRRFLSEGLLELADLSAPDTKCQLCGKAIPSGNYCLDCLKKLKVNVKTKKKEVVSEKKETKSFMLDYLRKKITPGSL